MLDINSKVTPLQPIQNQPLVTGTANPSETLVVAAPPYSADQIAVAHQPSPTIGGYPWQDVFSGLSVPTGVTTVMMSSGGYGKAIGVGIAGAGTLVNLLARNQNRSTAYKVAIAAGGTLTIAAAAATAYFGKSGIAAATVGGAGALLTLGLASGVEHLNK